jgi:hypothetical protein
MSVAIMFSPASGADKLYDESIRRLEAEGDFPPDGMEFHIAFGGGDAFRVLELWESQDKAQKFGERLMPLLQDIGIDPGQPEIHEVVNVARG